MNKIISASGNSGISQTAAEPSLPRLKNHAGLRKHLNKIANTSISSVRSITHPIKRGYKSLAECFNKLSINLKENNRDHEAIRSFRIRHKESLNAQIDALHSRCKKSILVLRVKQGNKIS